MPAFRAALRRSPTGEPALRPPPPAFQSHLSCAHVVQQFHAPELRAPCQAARRVVFAPTTPRIHRPKTSVAVRWVAASRTSFAWRHAYPWQMTVRPHGSRAAMTPGPLSYDMTMQLPIRMCDLRAQYLSIRTEIDSAIQSVIRSGEYERSEILWDFERQFAIQCQRRYAVGVGSGLAALFLTLKALGIGQGDEVITVPNTDISTCAAIRHCGATIVWCDVDPRTHNMDTRLIEERITRRTKAIVPVSLYGLPADLPRVQAIASAHGLLVISDAALAFGATIANRPVGAFGDAACFSFAPTKVLGAYGDGGIIVTNDPDLARTARILAGYGEPDPTGMADETGSLRLNVEGYHEHLDVIQAAILQAKLPHVGSWVGRRNQIADRYKQLLEPCSLQTQEVHPDITHAYRSFVVQVPSPQSALTWLRARGVTTQRLYAPPLHLQPAYADLPYRAGSFPVTDSIAHSLLCLPIYPELTDAEVDFVGTQLRSYLSED